LMEEFIEREEELQQIKKKIQLVGIERGEIRSLKPNRRVYQKRSNLFFLSDSKKLELAKKEEQNSLEKKNVELTNALQLLSSKTKLSNFQKLK